MINKGIRVSLLLIFVTMTPVIGELIGKDKLTVDERIFSYFRTYFPSHYHSIIENKNFQLAMLEGQEIDKNNPVSLIEIKLKYLEKKLKEPCQSNIFGYTETGVVISTYLSNSLNKYDSLVDCIDYNSISDIDIYYPEIASAFILDREFDEFRKKFYLLIDRYYSRTRKDNSMGLLVDLALVLCDEELLEYLSKYKVSQPKYFDNKFKDNIKTNACKLIDDDPLYYVGLERKDKGSTKK